MRVAKALAFVVSLATVALSAPAEQVAFDEGLVPRDAPAAAPTAPPPYENSGGSGEVDEELDSGLTRHPPTDDEEEEAANETDEEADGKDDIRDNWPGHPKNPKPNEGPKRRPIRADRPVVIPSSPKITINVSGINLYPVSSDEEAWSFFFATGEACSVSHHQLCCSTDCVAVPEDLTEKRPHQLGGLVVTFLPRNLDARELGVDVNNEINAILGSFDNSTMVEDTDAASAAMFSFAVSVTEAQDLRAQGRHNPENYANIAASAHRAAAAAEKAYAHITHWIETVDYLTMNAKEIDVKGDVMRIFPQYSMQTIRAAANRFSWFKTVASQLRHLEPRAMFRTSKLVAKMILNDLAANSDAIDAKASSHTLASRGALSDAVESLAQHTTHRKRSLEEKLKHERSRRTSLRFAPGTRKSSINAFRKALDGSMAFEHGEDKGVTDFSELYFGELNERQRNQLSKADLVASHTVYLTHAEFMAKNAAMLKRRHLADLAAATSTFKVEPLRPRGNDSSAGLRPRQVPPRPTGPGIVEQQDARSHLARISQKRSYILQGGESYFYHESAGAGVQMYFFGTGLQFGVSSVKDELRIPDSQNVNTNRDVQYMNAVESRSVVPPDIPDSDIIGGWLDDAWHQPNGERRGHATPMASLALGTEAGVAKKAVANSIKTAWAFDYNYHDEHGVAWTKRSVATNHEALRYAFEQALFRTETTGTHRKSVIVCPTDFFLYDDTDDTAVEAFWRDVLTRADEKGVVVVVNAGDHDFPEVRHTRGGSCEWQHNPNFHRYPHKLAVEFPGLIIANGLSENGLWLWANPMPDAMVDYHYAQGHNVEAFMASGLLGEMVGTWAAAGIVGGLAAYTIGLPATQEHLSDGPFGPKVRDLLLMYSFPPDEIRPRPSNVDMLGDLHLEFGSVCTDIPALASSYPYHIPLHIAEVHNEVYGIQNMCGDYYDVVTGSDSESGLHQRQSDDPYLPADPPTLDYCWVHPPSNTSAPDATGSEVSADDDSRFVPERPPVDVTLTGWEQVGCVSLWPYQELTSIMPLAFKVTNLVPKECARLCCGEKFFGLRGSTGCYCTEGPNVELQLGSMMADGECNVACDGDHSTACGGVEEVSLWRVKGPIATAAECGKPEQ